jgi:hypothetical protein
MEITLGCSITRNPEKDLTARPKPSDLRVKVDHLALKFRNLRTKDKSFVIAWHN